MRDYTLAHLSDSVLLLELAGLMGQDRLTTARMLAHIAEVDTRRLYAPAGYSSMHAYCVGELHLSEDSAYKRIRAARAAREFPTLFAAVAEGRLHLAGVCLLAPHLTAENVEELIGAATHRRKYEIEVWLARRFPSAEVRDVARAVIPVRAQLAPGPVASGSGGTNGELALGRVGEGSESVELALGRVGDGSESGELAPGRVETDAPAAATERYLVRVMFSKSTHDKLRLAQALLSHAVPAGDVARVLDRALDTLIAQLQRRKIGAVAKLPRGPEGQSAPQAAQRAAGVPRRREAMPSTVAGPCRPETPPLSEGGSRRHDPRIRRRHIPAPIRRAVWERDQGQCTFVSESGTRCQERRFLEFDHIEPVARGGRATVEGMRLRCQAHNQYEAERVFGAGFMSRKREEARNAASRPETVATRG
jgi:5-methylcytosine-specific restriction endonuclease McrA